MSVERIGADVCFRREPRTAKEAYDMLIISLSTEIKEKQIIIDELKDKDIKRKFFQVWKPGIRNINIHDIV